MARYIDPVCKLCRREGMKLYLKGSRCDSPKCPIERTTATRRPACTARRGKLSEYGIRLREKQKLKRFYGVLERQFRRYFALAVALAGEHRRGAAEHPGAPAGQRRPPARLRPSRGQRPPARRARPRPAQRPACDIPSMLLKPGDTIKVKNRPSSRCKLVKLELMREAPTDRSPTSWKSYRREIARRPA